MDAFEQLAKQLLEEDRYWVKSSVKIDLSIAEKKSIGKPTTPRPEVDIVAFDAINNVLFLIEVKSYIDSTGVDYDSIIKSTEVQEGRYKILTSLKYQEVLSDRLKKDWEKAGFIDNNTKISFGLIAGKVQKKREQDLEIYFEKKNLLFWDPTILKYKIEKLSTKSYENNPITIAIKLLHQKL